jgi:hypothetical protein
MKQDEIRRWLVRYAWYGDETTRAAEVDCIMAQDGWRYVDAKADQFATANGGGRDAFSEGMNYALSALYECHDGPHLPACPAGRKESEEQIAYDEENRGYGSRSY